MAVHRQVVSIGNMICSNQIHVDWCCMCNHDDKTLNYLLLLHRDMVRELWPLILILFMEWLFSRPMKDALCSWRGAKVSKRRKQALYLAPLAVMWIIWRECKRRIIEGIEMPTFKCKSNMLSIFHGLFSGSVCSILNQFFDFAENLSFVLCFPLCVW